MNPRETKRPLKRIEKKENNSLQVLELLKFAVLVHAFLVLFWWEDSKELFCSGYVHHRKHQRGTRLRGNLRALSRFGGSRANCEKLRLAVLGDQTQTILPHHCLAAKFAFLYCLAWKNEVDSGSHLGQGDLNLALIFTEISKLWKRSSTDVYSLDDGAFKQCSNSA